MLTRVKNWLYNVLVESRIVFSLLPVLGPLFGKYVTRFVKPDYVTDESGRTMRVTKWNGKIVSPIPYGRYATVKDIRVRKDDVFLAGYPKTGCHWLYEILYMLTHRKAEPSKHGCFYEGMFCAIPDIFLDSVPSPRVLNSHFLYGEHPTGIKEHRNKIVLTIRCPKDTVVSFYHHTKTKKAFYDYDGTFDDYFEMFMKGHVDFGTYFDYYTNWANVLNQPQDNPVFLIEFEDLKEDPVKKIMELANFLEISISDDFAKEVANASNFSTLKKTTKSQLLRKGVVGDWRNVLSKEQVERVDRTWRDKMAGLELPGGNPRYCV